MAATVSSASSGPRYAPEDPTLPKPWKGLVDGKTGYLYFWNPVTNVTQYERPAISGAPPPKPASAPLSSSVQVHQSSQPQYRNGTKEENEWYNGDSNGGPKLAAIPTGRNQQSGRSGSGHPDNLPNGSMNIAHGGSSMFSDGPSAQALKTTDKVRPNSLGSSLSVEAYRRQHEITIAGDDVPAPFMTFESATFPPEILREVRYLLQRGANVVRCAALL